MQKPSKNIYMLLRHRVRGNIACAVKKYTCRHPANGYTYGHTEATKRFWNECNLHDGKVLADFQFPATINAGCRWGTCCVFWKNNMKGCIARKLNRCFNRRAVLRHNVFGPKPTDRQRHKRFCTDKSERSNDVTGGTNIKHGYACVDVDCKRCHVRGNHRNACSDIARCAWRKACDER